MSVARALAVLGAAGVAVWAPGFAVAQSKEERIAFASNRDGNSEIFLMEGDGSNPTRLTTNPAIDVLPSMPAVASKVAFVSDRDGGNVEIYVMNANGSGLQRLTNNPRIDTFESFSPDGSKLAWATNRDAPPGDDDVRYSEIYVMNADGSGQTRLTNNAVFDGFPSWTPDGSKILFTTTRDGGVDAEIYTMNPDGSLQARITDNDIDEGLPTMSPDGAKIAFTSHSDGDLEIYVMNADGSGQTQLTNDFSVPLPLPLPQPAPSDEFSAWTPDSSRIVFGTTRGGNEEIYSMSATDGSGMRNLTQREALDGDPSLAKAPPPGQPGSGPLPGTARARPQGVSVAGTARCTARNRKRLCRIRLRGRVQRPRESGASCLDGSVTVTVRLGRRMVLSATAPTTNRCEYALSRRFRLRISGRPRAFRVTPRFSGNGFLTPATGAARRIRVR